MITAQRTSFLVAACVAAALATGLSPTSAAAQSGLDSVTINSTGQVTEDGTITLSGTYRCSTNRPGPVFIGSKVTQGDARADVGGTLATCDGRNHTWRNSGQTDAEFVAAAARGEATLLQLDFSGGLIPFPRVLGTDQRDLKLQER